MSAGQRGETVDGSWSVSAPEDTFDVQVNALDVDQLFELYERTGFLYPSKAARLRPHMDTVRDHWRRLLQTDSLLYVLSSGHNDGHASIAVWRTTRGSWVWQHLISEGSPLRSRSVLLGGLARAMRNGIGGDSLQNWFRPDNRFPARVFGSMVRTVGASNSSVQPYAYFAMPRRPSRPGSGSLRVVPYDASHNQALCVLGTLARGPLYVQAEDLAQDVELQTIDSVYRTVGLRRTRQVWLAYRGRPDIAVGAAIAYRGPLGLNFSFLENRCDLLLHPALSGADAFAVTSALVGALGAGYADFELDEIPIVADQSATQSLHSLGGHFLRNYCQGICLKDGQGLLYRHVDRFYERVRHRLEQRAVPSTLSA